MRGTGKLGTLTDLSEANSGSYIAWGRYTFTDLADKSLSPFPLLLSLLPISLSPALSLPSSYPPSLPGPSSFPFSSSLIHSINKYFLGIYFVSDMVMGMGYRVGTK